MTTSVAGLFVRNWYPSNVICYVTTPLGVLFGAASVFSLTSVAVARYLMIVMPFTYADKATPSVAKFVLGCVWSASIILSFPPITWRPDEIICRSGAVSDSYKTSELVYIIFLWFFVIIFPSAIMLPSYIHIFAVTSYQLRRISLTVPGEQNARKALRRRREVWTAIVLALIGGIFILCWFPFFVILTLHKFASGEVNPMYFKIFLCWMYTNSALNPVILVSFNREIRSAVCRTFASFDGVDSDRSSHSRSYLYSRSCPWNVSIHGFVPFETLAHHGASLKSITMVLFLSRQGTHNEASLRRITLLSMLALRHCQLWDGRIEKFKSLLTNGMIKKPWKTWPGTNRLTYSTTMVKLFFEQDQRLLEWFEF